MTNESLINTETKSVGDWFKEMPLTSAHVSAGFALFITFVIESWEMMIIIFSSGAIAAEWGLDTAQIGSLIGALFIGMIPGTLIWGKLAGTYGRKRCMMVSLLLYSLFPLMSALAPSYDVLWWLRFSCGIALSGALVVTFPYFQELSPVNVRGKATVYLSAGWPVGVLVAIGVTALLSDFGWRWVIGFSTIAGLWTFVVYKFVPESPYWLAEKGRVEEASATVEALAKGRLSNVSVAVGKLVDQDIPFSSIFRGDALRTTIIQTVVNFCFSWGYWGLASWMPTLLAKRGLSTPDGLGFMALSALFMFPGYISASYFTGRFGRKKVMLAYVFIATIAGFGFANSGALMEMYVWNFTLAFFSLGAWGVWNTWMGEIYDTRARTAGTGWGVSAQRIANSVAPVVIGTMLLTSTFLQTVAFISSFLAITFFTAMLLPETEGTTLK
ncbi:MAG: MFS transporter [Candidatus Azotimanducaceae bacterium WSBS_2022_MAG_OTU7]